MSLANVAGATFREIDFVRSKLVEWSRSHVSLFSAMFERVELSLASFRRMKLKKASFSDSVLRETDLSGSVFD